MSSPKQISDDPRTKEDFLLYRSIYYAGAGAAFVALLQLADKNYSTYNFYAATLLIAATVGLLACGAVYELISINWDKVRLQDRRPHKIYVAIMAAIAITSAIVGGVMLLHKVLLPGSPNGVTASQLRTVKVAVTVLLLSWAAILVTLTRFKRALGRSRAVSKNK